MSTIEELKFDKKNFNKHTAKGMGLLEKSLQQFGAGRSILVDKDNNIIAGNGIVEAAASAGITKTRVVETTGDELVVVKRNDVELDSLQGREMALADNATAAADLDWDYDNIIDEVGAEKASGWLDNIETGIKQEKDIENNPPTITSSFITVDYADEIELKITEETAQKLMGELLEYNKQNGTYDGFWDERLK